MEMKGVCENPLAMMLEYVFFDFAPFSLEGRVSSLQDYLGYMSAKEEIVSSINTIVWFGLVSQSTVSCEVCSSFNSYPVHGSEFP